MTRHLAWIAVAGFCTLLHYAAAIADPPTAVTLPATGDSTYDLALAAACIERGEETAAVAYLSRFITAHPDQPLVRASLAELLWRREQITEARHHFECFISDAQLAGTDASRQVHAHTRLVAIAQRSADAYSEHLHRGIGLFLLASHATSQDSGATEGFLCKAAGELSLAQCERPDQARPNWYLYLVWTQLGQSQPAARSLRRAAAVADWADLSPAERRDLAVARADANTGR